MATDTRHSAMELLGAKLLGIGLEADATPPQWLLWVGLHTFSAPNRARFYQRVIGLITGGAQLQQGIEFLYERSHRRSPSTAQTVVLWHINHALEEGHSLGAALNGIAPPAEVMLIEAGELNNRLENSLEDCVSLIKNTSRMREAVVGALSQAAMMLFVTVLSLIAMADYVTPKLALAVSPSHWTGAGRSLYVVSEVVNTWEFNVAIGILGAMIIVLPFTFPYWTGRLRAVLDKMPPWSFYRLLQGGSWLMSFSSMMVAGMQAAEALRQMMPVANPYLRERLRALSWQLQSGVLIGSALDNTGYEFPDNEVVEDLVAFESQGTLDEALGRVGKEFIDRGLSKVESQAAAMRTLLTLLFGLVIAWIALGTVQIQIDMQASLMSGF